MSLADKRYENIESVMEDFDLESDEEFWYYEKDIKQAVKRILKVFHIGTLYEGESIWKIIEKEIGKELCE